MRYASGVFSIAIAACISIGSRADSGREETRTLVQDLLFVPTGEDTTIWQEDANGLDTATSG
jgi:hypothetical protein